MLKIQVEPTKISNERKPNIYKTYNDDNDEAFRLLAPTLHTWPAGIPPRLALACLQLKTFEKLLLLKLILSKAPRERDKL